MGDIYHGARQVFSWLGPEANGSRRLMLFLKYYEEGDVALMDQDDHARLVQFLQRTYWTRTWVLQEVILASDLTLCCGSDLLPWSKLSQALSSYSAPEASHFKNLARARELALDLTVNSRAHEDFEDLVVDYSHTECEDPRDHVYALLGLAKYSGLDTDIAADYRLGREEMFRQLWESRLLRLRETIPHNQMGWIDYNKSLIDALRLNLPSRTPIEKQRCPTGRDWWTWAASRPAQSIWPGNIYPLFPRVYRVRLKHVQGKFYQIEDDENEISFSLVRSEFHGKYVYPFKDLEPRTDTYLIDPHFAICDTFPGSQTLQRAAVLNGTNAASPEAIFRATKKPKNGERLMFLHAEPRGDDDICTEPTRDNISVPCRPDGSCEASKPCEANKHRGVNGASDARQTNPPMSKRSGVRWIRTFASRKHQAVQDRTVCPKEHVETSEGQSTSGSRAREYFRSGYRHLKSWIRI